MLGEELDGEMYFDVLRPFDRLSITAIRIERAGAFSSGY